MELPMETVLATAREFTVEREILILTTSAHATVKGLIVVWALQTPITNVNATVKKLILIVVKECLLTTANATVMRLTVDLALLNPNILAPANVMTLTVVMELWMLIACATVTKCHVAWAISTTLIAIVTALKFTAPMEHLWMTYVHVTAAVVAAVRTVHPRMTCATVSALISNA